MSLRITFVPRYSRNAASTRLRCYAIAEAINRLKLADVWIAEQGHLPDGTDVAIAQKTVDQAVIARMHESCHRIIYDADDIIEPNTKLLISLYASAVTTDTPCRAEGIRQWFRGPVHVIPDPIDYEDGPPKAPNPDAHDGRVWFGNWPNFESIRGTMRIYRDAGVRIGAISDLSAERANMSGLELIPWSYDTFPEELRKWDACVLSHEGADQCKSENKMVAAIYLGVTPIYLEGTAYLELGNKLHGLSIRDAQAYIWEHYRAEVVARKAMEVYAG